MEEIFSTKNVVLLVAAVGGVSGIIGLLKTVPNNLWVLFRQRYIHSITLYRHTGVYEEFNDWFYKNYSHKFKHVEIERDYNDSPNNTNEEKDNIFQKEGSFFINYKGSILYINKFKIELKMSNNNRPALDTYQIYSLKRKNIDELLKDIKSNKNQNVKTSIYTNNNYGDWNLFQKIDKKDINTVIIDKYLKNTIVTDLEDFILSKQWYIDRGIPYTRGHLYYGKPGNGKTSLCTALASYFNKDIYSIDLSTLDDDNSLKNCFRYLKDNSILLIEDVDKAFLKRDESNKGITFACMLNCLNGVYSKQGVITIMTTNHIENLDPALIRSGRIDMKVEIENPDKTIVNDYLNLFFNTDDILIDYKGDYYMADIQNICIQNKNNKEEAIRQLSEKYLNIA